MTKLPRPKDVSTSRERLAKAFFANALVSEPPTSEPQPKEGPGKGAKDKNEKGKAGKDKDEKDKDGKGQNEKDKDEKDKEEKEKEEKEKEEKEKEEKEKEAKAKANRLKQAAVIKTDSPGTWRHPRLNEITRRREATTFTEKNVRRIAYNILALLSFWTIQVVVKMNSGLQTGSPAIRLYISWVWTFVQFIPLVQIALAFVPLFRARDDMTDIPLSAAQRKLLGLEPVAAPANPQLTFTTPPRYSRTPSIAGSIGSRGSYTQSPLSGRGGSPFQNSTTGSPFSPLESPLLQKSRDIFGNSTNNRRSSSGSPFSVSTSVNPLGDPGSPSPAGGNNAGGGSGGGAAKRTSVGLNSKWLYEKGRRSSGSAWVH